MAQFIDNVRSVSTGQFTKIVKDISGGGGGSGEIQVPSGGTADRPDSPTVGDLFWDTTLDSLLVWDGSSWSQSLRCLWR